MKRSILYRNGLALLDLKEGAQNFYLVQRYSYPNLKSNQTPSRLLHFCARPLLPLQSSRNCA